MLLWVGIIWYLQLVTLLVNQGVAVASALVIVTCLFIKRHWQCEGVNKVLGVFPLPQYKWHWVAGVIWYSIHSYIHSEITFCEVIDTGTWDDVWHSTHFFYWLIVIRPFLFGYGNDGNGYQINSLILKPPWLKYDAFTIFFTTIAQVTIHLGMDYGELFGLYNGAFQTYKFSFENINYSKHSFYENRSFNQNFVYYLGAWIYLLTAYASTREDMWIGTFMHQSNIAGSAFWTEFFVLFWKIEIKEHKTRNMY